MRLSRPALSTAAIGLLLLAAAPGYASPAEPAGPSAPVRDCAPATPAAPDRTDHDPSCLDVGLTLSRLPEVGGQADLDVTVRTTAAEDAIDLAVELPDHLVWVNAPGEAAVTTTQSAVPIDRGQVSTARSHHQVLSGAPLTLHGTVKAVGTGPAEIRATATATGGADAATAARHLTIGTDASTSGIAVKDVGDVVPTTMPGTRSSLAWTHKPVATPGTQTRPDRGQACVTGTWNYVEHTGYTRVSANAAVEVYDAETGAPDELLVSGFTDAEGRYSLCFDNKDAGDRTQDVYVRLSTDNPQFVVRSKVTKQPYRFATATKRNVKTGGVVDFGAVQPSAPELMRGVEAFDTANTGWNFVPGGCWDARDTTCRKAVVNWEPDSTTCCWYDLQQDAAYIAAATPDTPIVVLHELGHGLMDDVYEDAYPPFPNCSPHSLHRASSAGCAWTEGWPTFFAATALRDYFFRWEDGRILDLENATWGTALPGRVWENGDLVEGRVAGALIDLSDAGRNEAADTCAEDPQGPLWNTFLDHVSGTFHEFWQQRAADGHDVGATALACLQYNTIDYRS
ncbi:hypothetical protein ACIQ9R_14980 [Streptomyces sp. NPDC094447]|uniref:hypothetical protein n=1 Tax=Streptomyces sp. NPDC094447 TaxID=3366062 RepID=UPI00382CC5AF